MILSLSKMIERAWRCLRHQDLGESIKNSLAKLILLNNNNNNNNKSNCDDEKKVGACDPGNDAIKNIAFAQFERQHSRWQQLETEGHLTRRKCEKEMLEVIVGLQFIDVAINDCNLRVKN